MGRNKFDDLTFAERLIDVSEGFLSLHSKGGNTVDFAEMSVTRHRCRTVACHGGFAVLLFPKKGSTTFADGGERLAQHLGFSGYDAILNWAKSNPELWGSEWGDHMFSYTGYKSFGRDVNDGTVTLLVIAQWYANVAARVLGLAPREVIYEGL